MTRVLIVDDDAAIRELLTVQLTFCGIQETATAESGVRALEMIDAGGVFDLIVTDLCMPVMTGSELIGILRSRGSAVPVILLTGAARPPVIEGVLTVCKPYKIDALIAAIGQTLRPSVD